jgi:hypothetical protein
MVKESVFDTRQGHEICLFSIPFKSFWRLPDFPCNGYWELFIGGKAAET